MILSDALLLIGPTYVWECSPVSQNGPELSTQARLHQHVQIFTVLECPVQPEHKQQSSFPSCLRKGMLIYVFFIHVLLHMVTFSCNSMFKNYITTLMVIVTILTGQ